jgi:nicotinamidase-related amidase
MSHTCLLVVDIQNEVFHRDGALAGDFPEQSAAMLDAVRRLVGWAHEHSHHVIWLRLAFRPGHAARSWTDRGARSCSTGWAVAKTTWS